MFSRRIFQNDFLSNISVICMNFLLLIYEQDCDHFEGVLRTADIFSTTKSQHFWWLLLLFTNNVMF